MIMKRVVGIERGLVHFFLWFSPLAYVAQKAISTPFFPAETQCATSIFMPYLEINIQQSFSP